MISLVRQRLLNPTTGYQAVRALLTNQQLGMDKFVSNKEINIRINKSSYSIRILFDSDCDLRRSII